MTRREFGYFLSIYTSKRRAVDLTYGEFENDAIEKLVTTMKDYFEKEK